MTEDQLLGPRAHGEPCGSAVLKAVAEDFQVDEVLDIPLSGQGEHLWLWVEKRNLNTEEAAKRIARARVSDEGREGVAAFLEKRKASWTV